MKRITFTDKKRAELVDDGHELRPLGADEIRGRTLVSLVSPGTEINSGFLGKKFPSHPGYACVFQVEETGSQVDSFVHGDVVYFAGGHAEVQQAHEHNVVKVPTGLAPEKAVFARLMAVSMSTLNTTTARPPSPVLVTGLGPVGNLAAQVFAHCGYQVTALEPVEARRAVAHASGIKDVHGSPDDVPELVGKFALHVECSGHEAAVLQGCQAVRQRGEVVLLGVPWTKKTDISAFEVLNAIFHKYAVVRSGWEWEIPEKATPFMGNNRMENYAAALRWIQQGAVKVEGLAVGFAPSDCQAAYEGLMEQKLAAPGVVFDWR